MDDSGWMSFPEWTFKNEYQIHPTRSVGWIRARTPTGKWVHSGTARLVGAEGKPRRVDVQIEGKKYKRHRLIALAKYGSAEGLAKFRDWKNNPVLHGKRRREDERPDDHPENVDFGTKKKNRNDPNNKKREKQASGHPVRLTTECGHTVVLGSVLEAARYLGANMGNLVHYLNKTNGVKNMPMYKLDGIWDAVYDGFDMNDAIRIVRAAGSLFVCRSRPNELFRKLPDGKFVTVKLEKDYDGYVKVLTTDGRREMLHRLVVETLDPMAFETKLETMPTGVSKGDLQVDHIDGDESNNAISNLRVVAAEEHARKHAFEVEWIDDDGNVLGVFACAADAVSTVRGVNGKSIDAANVRAVCDHKQKRTGGRLFRWKDEALVEEMRSKKLKLFL